MERRKFVIGLGSLAAGGAAATGTGAFSTVTERSMEVDVVGEANAYAAIDPNTDSEYVESASPMEIDLASDQNGGSGLAPESDTLIAPAFTLENQSNETLYVEIYNPLANGDIDTPGQDYPNYSGRGGGRERSLPPEGLDIQFFATGSLPITPQSAIIDRPSNTDSGIGGEFDDIGSDEVVFASSADVDNISNRTDLEDFDFGALELGTGESVEVSVRIVVNSAFDPDSEDIPALDFRIEAYDSADPLTYDVV
jgi:hypothetical protein